MGNGCGLIIAFAVGRDGKVIKVISKVIKQKGKCLIKAARGPRQGNMIKMIKVITYARLDLIMFL
jgi:hypothetical protein